MSLITWRMPTPGRWAGAGSTDRFFITVLQDGTFTAEWHSDGSIRSWSGFLRWAEAAGWCQEREGRRPIRYTGRQGELFKENYERPSMDA